METEGQTDATKLVVTFHNFSKAPNKENNVHENNTLVDYNICLCFVKEVLNN